jgi:hypothetical protein
MNSNQQNIMIDEYLKAFAEPSTHLGVKKTIPMQYAGKDYLFVVQEVLVTDAIKDMFHVSCYSGENLSGTAHLFKRSDLARWLGDKFTSVFPENGVSVEWH